jgi:hypothetical protein
MQVQSRHLMVGTDYLQVESRYRYCPDEERVYGESSSPLLASPRCVSRGFVMFLAHLPIFLNGCTK